MGLNANDLNIP